MAYVFAAPAQVVVPVAGSNDLFPVRRVYCVGRNYGAHAREMGHDEREPPFFFAKPADAVVPMPAAGSPAAATPLPIPYPPRTNDLHHEIECVIAIGAHGVDVAAADAAKLVWGYAAGLDLTRRDLQGEMKKQGRPWEIGKGFDFSAPMSAIRPSAAGGLLANARIWLNVNGQPRQQSDIAEMTWKLADIVAHLSTYFALAPGDLIFTGTPEGVGPVVRGDLIEGGVEGVGTLRVRIE